MNHLRFALTAAVRPLLAVVLGLALAHAVQAAPKVVRIAEQGAETQSLDIFLSSASAGRVTARLCDYCETLTLEIDAQTRVFYLGELVPLETAVERRDEGATVFFDPDTLRVTRIVLWR